MDPNQIVSVIASSVSHSPRGGGSSTSTSAAVKTPLSTSLAASGIATGIGRKTLSEIDGAMVERMMEESLQRGNPSLQMFSSSPSSSSSSRSSVYLDEEPNGSDDDDDDDCDDFECAHDPSAQKPTDSITSVLSSPASVTAAATLPGGDLLAILRSYKPESVIRYDTGLDLIKQGKAQQGLSYIGEAILLNERVMATFSKEVSVAVFSNRFTVPKDIQPLQKALPEQQQSPQDEAFISARRPRTTPEILARVAQQQHQSQQKSSRSRGLQAHPPLRGLLFRAVLYGYFWYKRNDLLSAVNCFSELLLCCREGSPFLTYRGRLHELRALCYIKLKDFTKARRDLCASLSLDNSPHARILRGKLYFYVGHNCGWRSETIDDLNKFIEYSADNPFECKDRADAHVYLSVIHGENSKLRDLVAGLRHYRRGMVEIRKWMIIGGEAVTTDVATVVSRDPVYKKAVELYRGYHPCEVCEMPAKMVCAKCREAWYCSRECQMADWKGNNHKDKCPEMLRKRLDRKEMIRVTKEQVKRSSQPQKHQKQSSAGDGSDERELQQKQGVPQSSSSSSSSTSLSPPLVSQSQASSISTQQSAGKVEKTGQSVVTPNMASGKTQKK